MVTGLMDTKDPALCMATHSAEGSAVATMKARSQLSEQPQASPDSSAVLLHSCITNALNSGMCCHAGDAGREPGGHGS